MARKASFRAKAAQTGLGSVSWGTRRNMDSILRVAEGFRREADRTGNSQRLPPRGSGPCSGADFPWKRASPISHRKSASLGFRLENSSSPATTVVLGDCWRTARTGCAFQRFSRSQAAIRGLDDFPVRRRFYREAHVDGHPDILPGDPEFPGLIEVELEA